MNVKINARCRAKDPARCVDPRCPEKTAYVSAGREAFQLLKDGKPGEAVKVWKFREKLLNGNPALAGSESFVDGGLSADDLRSAESWFKQAEMESAVAGMFDSSSSGVSYSYDSLSNEDKLSFVSAALRVDKSKLVIDQGMLVVRGGEAADGSKIGAAIVRDNDGKTFDRLVMIDRRGRELDTILEEGSPVVYGAKIEHNPTSMYYSSNLRKTTALNENVRDALLKGGIQRSFFNIKSVSREKNDWGGYDVTLKNGYFFSIAKDGSIMEMEKQ